MSRLIVRKLGSLAAAAVLLTAPTPSFAAPPADSPSVYLTKKKATTLVGLSRELQQSAIQMARSRPGAPKLTTQGGAPTAGPSDKDLDEICGDWFITWEEDADGDPKSGTFELHCGDSVIPLP